MGGIAGFFWQDKQEKLKVIGIAVLRKLVARLAGNKPARLYCI